MKPLLFALGLMACASPLQAQTVSRALHWSVLDDRLEHVQENTWTLSIDGGDVVIILPVCVYTDQVTCRVPIELAPGDHTIVLVATNGGGQAWAQLDYEYEPPPIPPSNLKVIVTVTVP